MRIPSAVLASVDYHAVVVAELSVRNRYLPPPLADRALRANSEELADRLKTLMRREFHPSPHDSILARKAGRGSRPLPYIALEDRLVYRALVTTLADRFPDDPGRGDYEAFTRSPLDADGCRYVLKADISAYYQYIDHEQLIDEVVAQTGDDLAITAVVELLEGGTGRRFGLPQMQSPSDILADTYVDPIRRRLALNGHVVTRYADDFRVACGNYSDALASLELIERAAFDLGLVLNEAKTSSPSRVTYEESLSEVPRAERQLFDQLAEEGVPVEDFYASDGDTYADTDATEEFGAGIEFEGLPGLEHDEVDPDDETGQPEAPQYEQLEVANRVVTMWHSDEGTGYGWSGSVWSAMLRKSLYTLETGRDDRAVASAISLLVREPHLTPQVSNYLIAVGQGDPDQISFMLDELCGSNVVSPWQSLWAAFVAGSIPRRSRSSEHANWLRDQTDSSHAAVSAQAALALARRRSLPVEMAARVYERAPQAHRPTVALALAAAHGVADTDFGQANQLEGWLRDWVKTQRWGRRRTAEQVPRRRRVQS